MPTILTAGLGVLFLCGTVAAKPKPPGQPKAGPGDTGDTSGAAAAANEEEGKE